jgi:hypothetical protein
MCGFVINMNEGPVNSRQDLELVLQQLRNIVRSP